MCIRDRVTPYCSAQCTTGLKFLIKVARAASLRHSGQNLYSALGAPVSVPTIPQPSRLAKRIWA